MPPSPPPTPTQPQKKKRKFSFLKFLALKVSWKLYKIPLPNLFFPGCDLSFGHHGSETAPRFVQWRSPVGQAALVVTMASWQKRGERSRQRFGQEGDARIASASWMEPGFSFALRLWENLQHLYWNEILQWTLIFYGTLMSFASIVGNWNWNPWHLDAKQVAWSAGALDALQQWFCSLKCIKWSCEMQNELLKISE